MRKVFKIALLFIVIVMVLFGLLYFLMLNGTVCNVDQITINQFSEKEDVVELGGLIFGSALFYKGYHISRKGDVVYIKIKKGVRNIFKKDESGKFSLKIKDCNELKFIYLKSFNNQRLILEKIDGKWIKDN